MRRSKNEFGATLAERLTEIRRRIGEACSRAGRDPAEVTLIGVSKRQPLERLEAAIAAGLSSFGENQMQEAEGKIPQLPVGLDWHFIGTLQSNKARSAVRHFDTIHSLDRLKIGRRLESEAKRQERRIRAFLQVHLGEEEGKHGFSPERFLDDIRPLRDELENVEIVGLMAIPPFDPDLERVRSWFRQLAELRDRWLAESQWKHSKGWLSMGMSHDFEIAIEEGATHVRIGSSLFGPRPG